MPTAPAKQRNYAVDFWRIFCTLGVTIMHFHLWESEAFPLNVVTLLGEGANPMFQFGGLLLGYFFMIGGYLMVASYKSKQRKGLTNVSPSTQAWKYTAGRFQIMFPAMLVGVIFGFISIGWVNNFSLAEWYNMFALGSWEFTGLDALGAMGMSAAAGSGHQWDLLNVDASRVLLFNFPLWYISGIIITAIFLYFLLARNEDSFKCIWAPFFSMVFLADFAFNAAGWGWLRDQTVLGIPINVLWVGGGMCIGSLLWYLVDWLKQREYSKKAKIGLTIVNIGASLYFILMSGFNYFQFNMVDATGAAHYNEHIFLPVMALLIVLNTLGEDYLTKCLNWPFLGKLGEYSLYYFICHHPMRTIAYHLGNVMSFTSYWQYFFVYIIGTIVTGIIAMVICKKWLNPLMVKFFNPKSKKEDPVPAPAAQN